MLLIMYSRANLPGEGGGRGTGAIALGGGGGSGTSVPGCCSNVVLSLRLIRRSRLNISLCEIDNFTFTCTHCHQNSSHTTLPSSSVFLLSCMEVKRPSKHCECYIHPYRALVHTSSSCCTFTSFNWKEISEIHMTIFHVNLHVCT